MVDNVTMCDNCGGKIVLSLNEHVTTGRVLKLHFCCQSCADNYRSQENPYPVGLAHDMGLEEGGW